MINYSLIIFAFLAGWFGQKKKQQIINLYYSIKLFIKMNKKDDMKYNDFFEADFHKSEYSGKENDNNV